MLKRKALAKIKEWHANKTDKQALLVTGARQVGKTYLIREFGKANYENLAELNLFENTTACEALETATSSRELFLRLSAFIDGDLVPGKTLVFIDEVQECANVVTMIKFLLERTDFDYIISGSMLGVELKSVKSLPVGYLSTIQMYPMDFEEFCWARSISASALEEAGNAFTNLRTVDPYIHKLLLDTFHEYLYVGGMPAAVDAFVSTNNLQTVRDRQGGIYEWYREDIAKYAGNQALIVKKIFDTLPSELSNQNKRFKISALEPKARLARYENDFIWLVDANVAIASFSATEPRAPLAASATSRLFKLFMCDVGLLTYAYGLETVRDMAAGRTDVKYGALYENAVAQELYSRRQNLHAPLYYFKNDRIGEIDFLITDSLDHVVPLEVKSGKSYKRHSALNNVLKTANYDIKQAYVLCEDNISTEGSVAYLPIYMIMFIGR
jgi:hypothetical protein